MKVVLALALAAAVVACAGCSHLVLLHDPLTASEHNDLGVAYESAGRLDLARREYKKSLRLAPRQSRTWVNLGNVEAARNRWPAAESCFRRALRDSSSNHDAMNNLAFALFQRRRRLDEALSLAERAAAAGGERDSIYRATLEEIRAARR